MRSALLIVLLWGFASADSLAESGPGQAAWLSEVQKDIQAREYHVTWQAAAGLRDADAAWQAPNRAHGFRSYFTDSGVRVIPRLESPAAPSWECRLSLIGYGRDRQLARVVAPNLIPEDNRIEYVRDGLVEWYVNEPDGLEQGFTLPAPPRAPAGPKKLVPGARRNSDGEAHLVLTLDGPLSARISSDAQSVEFAPRSGGPAVLYYGHLEVRDAQDRRLESWIEGFAEAGVRGIRLVFDDADAVYPVTVDPLLQSAAWEVEGDQSGDQFGWSVASAGDVNCDGYDDVIVGVPGYDLTNSGRAYVYHGTQSGLETTPAWTAETGTWGFRFGSSVGSAGNVNGDIDTDSGHDCDDVFIASAKYGSQNVVYVYHGSPSGLAPFCEGPDCEQPNPLPNWGDVGEGPLDEFGGSVSSAGDVNCDGYDDLIVGAPMFSVGSGTSEGKVYVYYGDGIGLDPYALPSWTAVGEEPGAEFGTSVAAAGNVNGDIDTDSGLDCDDVVIGAPGHSALDNGRAYVYLGSGAGLESTASWFQNGDQGHSRFGWSVGAAGNVDGGVLDDIIIGAPFYDNGEYNEGRVYVYFGQDNSIPPYPPISSSSWTAEGDQDNAQFGFSVGSAGDVNGDGHGDVVIGTPYWDADAATDAGRVWIYEGAYEWGLGDEKGWTWSLEGDQSGENLGVSAASAGDVNGDGYGDLIVGSAGYSYGQDQEGRARVYHGAPNVAAPDLADHLGFPNDVDTDGTHWGVQPSSVAGEVPNPSTPDAVSYGPIPGSVLVTTGRVIDRASTSDFPQNRTGISDVDWGADGEGDVATFELALNVPSWAETLRFTTQYLTNGYPFDTDSATVELSGEAGGWVPLGVYPLDETTRWYVNAPVSHCVNLVSGWSKIKLVFRVEDTDGSDDSGVLISRAFFSDLPLPSDITPSNDGEDGNSDGIVDYFVNPAPHDVSLTSGTFTHVVDLFSIPGMSMPFQFSILYNSQSDREGSLGRKWTHSYDGYTQEIRIDADSDGSPETLDTVLVRHGAGTAEYFEPDPAGGFRPKSPAIKSTLIQYGHPGAPYELVTRDHLTYRFLEGGDDPGVRLLGWITDPNGNVFALAYGTYDGRKKISHIDDTRGEQIVFDYDTTGRLKSIEYEWDTLDEPPQTVISSVRFDYDLATSDLVSVTDLNGYTTTFDYDPFGNLLTVTNADGVITVANSYEQYQGIDLFQVGDRVVTRRDAKDDDPFNPEAGVSYDYDYEALRQTDRLGYQDTRHYDVEGRMARRVGPGGVLWEFEFDRRGNVIETRRKLPSDEWPRTVSVASYDERGNLISKTDFPGTCIGGPGTGGSCSIDADCPQSSCGVRQTSAYDAYDNLVASSDHLGNTTTLAYDADHNLLALADPLGSSVSDSHTSLGQSATTTTPGGNVYTCTYGSSLGQPTSVENPDGSVVSYVYDGLGRRVSTTDPNDNTTTVEYDDGGRAISQTDPLGNRTEYTYDSAGRPLSTLEANGALTTATYTRSGRLASETDPLGNTTTYEYDEQDRVTSMTDPLGRTVSFDYDAVGRMTYVEACEADAGTDGAPDCIDVHAVFDEVGNLVELIDPKDNSVHFEHDLLGRVTRETNALGASLTYAYDGRGLLTRQTNARGQAIGYDYDAAGRLTGAELPGGSITHTYDASGNPVATVSDRYASATRAFDVMDRLVERTDEFGNTVGYEYDPAGNLRALTYSDGSKVVYAYDQLNRLKWLEDWYDSANPPPDPYPVVPDDCTASAFCRLTTYAYDSVGNPISVGLPDGSTVTYGYDLAGRVTSLSDLNGTAGTIVAATYSYDAAGRRTSAQLTLPLDPTIDTEVHDLTYNELNQVVSRGSDTYAYDADGNLTGGVLDGTAVSISYDELNLLSGINGDTFRHDVDGLRVQSVRAGETRRYVHDPTAGLSRLLEEHDENGNLIARYVYGLGLVSRQAFVLPEYHVYHFDSRGSTVALTDDSGAITDKYAYDPYGAPAGYAGTTGAVSENPFRYNGHDGVVDDGNGLYYMRNRYYAPELMRFIQQDVVPTGLTDAQSLNRYSFVKGNPIQFVDPDGNWSGVDDLFAVIGGAIVGVVSQFVECAIGSGGSFSGEGCGWEDFTGAAAGGATWGLTMLYTGNPAIAGAAQGFVDSLATNGFKAIPGGQDTSWAEFGTDLGMQVGAGAALGALNLKAFKVGADKAVKTFGAAFETAGRSALSKEWGKSLSKNLGQAFALQGLGKGAFKGAMKQGFWLGGGGSTPVDRSTRPPGDVWNQSSDPQADAWAGSSGRRCIEYAWR